MQADELSLATRAAWLSYVGNHTQEEIAGRLGVSRIKVNRLIGQAVRAGLVHVFVEGTAAECIALEEAIAAPLGSRVLHRGAAGRGQRRCRWRRWPRPAGTGCTACWRPGGSR